MEQDEKFRTKLKVYKKAVDGLSKSINIDTTVFTEDVADAIKNGCIQKFEYLCQRSHLLLLRISIHYR